MPWALIHPFGEHFCYRVQTFLTQSAMRTVKRCCIPFSLPSYALYTYKKSPACEFMFSRRAVLLRCSAREGTSYWGEDEI